MGWSCAMARRLYHRMQTRSIRCRPILLLLTVTRMNSRLRKDSRYLISVSCTAPRFFNDLVVLVVHGISPCRRRNDFAGGILSPVLRYCGTDRWRAGRSGYRATGMAGMAAVLHSGCRLALAFPWPPAANDQTHSDSCGGQHGRGIGWCT